MMLNEISEKAYYQTSFQSNDVAQNIYVSFNYQLDQNTCCNLKFAFDITRQLNRLTNRHRSSQSEPCCLSQVCPSFTFGVTPMMWG